MRILFHLHGWPSPSKGHYAGGERTAEAMAVWLASRGHEVAVVCPHRTLQGIFDGVEVALDPGVGYPIQQRYAGADVVITHLDMTRSSVRLARRAKKPLVHLLHNHRQLIAHRVKPADAALVVFNSEWLKEAVKWKGPQIVIRPPLMCGKFWTPGQGSEVVMSNLTPTKGVHLFYELASRMPEHRFLGVMGAYGQQIVPDPLPVNVEVIEAQADPRVIYKRARVVLMPSDYESWGRIAVEATCSGIPAICSPMPGPLEALEEAGTFVRRDDIDGWEFEVRQMLENNDWWDKKSEQAKIRARELNPTVELLAFEEALLALV